MSEPHNHLRWTTPPKRVLLKLSGEALKPAGSNDIIDWPEAERMAAEIYEVHQKYDTQFAIVVGAGNIWRGVNGIEQGMNPALADEMGMIATTLNALALQNAFKRVGYESRVMTAVHMDQFMEKYIRNRAVRHLEKGRVVILAGGMGLPNFTTDTTAVNRAVELEVDLLLKGTHGDIDGIYTADPRKDSSAKKYDTVTFDEVVQRRLKVMDGTAFTLAQDAPHKFDLGVFSSQAAGDLAKIINGEPVGTLVTHNGSSEISE